MKPTAVFLGVILFLSACKGPSPADSGGTWPKEVHPPVAVKKSHDRILFGDTVRDNYYWMADYFSKGPDSSLAVEYLKAENAYLDTMMSGTKTFQPIACF